MINYPFGLINVTLFAVIFFPIQLYASFLLQLFFFVANVYGWYAWSRQTDDRQATLKIRWLPLPKALDWGAACVIAIALMTRYIDPVFAFLTRIAVSLMNALGLEVAMILMTRKYVENLLLWVVISVMIFARQGVYDVAGVRHPDADCA